MANPHPKAARLEQLIQEKRTSATKVANAIGVNKQTLLNWMSGDTMPRDEAKLDEALLFLGSGASKGTGPGLSEPFFPVATEEVRIPLGSALPAAEEWGDLEDTADFIDIPYFLTRRKGVSPPKRTAHYVRGESMMPRLRPGDLVVLEHDPTPRTGRLFVATGEGMVTVKVLRRDAEGHGYYLEAINREGEVTPLKSQLVGYLVAILRDYASGRGIIEWDDGGLGP